MNGDPCDPPDPKSCGSNELAFDPNIAPRSPADLGTRLGLRAPTSAQHLEMRNSLLANLRLAHMQHPRARVFYSRDHAHYARTRRWSPPSYTRRVIVDVVDELEGAGVVTHNRTWPSPLATKRSTLAAEPTLIGRLDVSSVEDLSYSLRYPIVLKDAGGQLLRFRSARRTRAMADDVNAQNEVLRSISIQLHDPAWNIDRYGLLRGVTGGVVNPQRVQLYRVFNNGMWSYGGRFYGGWWQQLPSETRLTLTIDGDAVDEEDYSGCHLNLMCAMAGIAPPDGDPYRVEAIEMAFAGNLATARQIAKISFQILLNANSYPSAQAAIASKIMEVNPTGSPPAASLVIKALKARFPAFQALWHSGLGLRLQRIDSDIAAHVMKRLRSKGIPTLPIHDSFVVQQRSRGELVDAMAAGFAVGLKLAQELAR
jgi:hypothetical protein